MKNNTLQNAFPIVAAAIGNRFGIKVSVGGDQAYTDGKSIQLPAYEGDDPDYQDYAWGLLAHEAAHIRYSDFSLAFGGSVLRRRLSGAIEDVRIEHELAKDFPGTRLTLRTVVEKMIAKGSFNASAASDHPANILYGYVLKSLRSRVLGQVALNPLVEQTETVLKATFPKGAVIRLKGLLSEVPDRLKSESDCLNLADRILTMIQQEVEQEKQQQSPQQQPSPSTQSDSDQADKGTEQTAAESEPEQSNNANESSATVPSEQVEEGDQSTQAENDHPEDADNQAASDQANSAQDEKPALSEPENDDDLSESLDNGGQSGSTDAASDVPDGLEQDSSGSIDNLQADDGEVEMPDPSQILEALLSAGDADIDQDVFETIKRP